MNAHTSPTAQYTLVNISGKNSSSPNLPPCGPVSGHANDIVQGSEVVVRDRASRGKNVTNSWRRGKPARYSFSRKSTITNEKVVGNLQITELTRD